MTQTPPPAILRPDSLPSHDRGGGARTTPLVTRSLGATGFISGITAFEPGAAIPLHFHDCEEQVTILEGEAVAEIDGARHPVRAGDTTWIPAGLPHRFVNAGAGPLRILWVYASTTATRTLVATGETRPVAAEHARPPTPQVT